jgi:hypothetical protein
MKKYAMDFIVNVLEEVKNNPTLSLAKIAENNNLTSGAPLIRWWIKRYNQFNKDIVEWRRNMADEKKDAFLATIENMNHQIEELKSEQNRMRQEHKKRVKFVAKWIWRPPFERQNDGRLFEGRISHPHFGKQDGG